MKLFSAIKYLLNPVTPVDLTPEVIAEIVAEAVKNGIKYVILHYVGVANADTSGKAISYYHKVTNGWKRDGYHLFLNHDGKIELLEPIGVRVNGCEATGWGKYSNEEYIGVKALQICFETVKGLQMSETQDKLLIQLFKALTKEIPVVLIGGHREFPDLTSWNKRQKTVCPAFSVSDWLLANGIPRRNVFYEVWKP